MASSFAVTAPGRELVRERHPLGDPAAVRLEIDLLSECRRLLAEGVQSGIEHCDDLSDHLRKLAPEESVLEPRSLRAFLPLFSSSLNLKSLDLPEQPHLKEILSGIHTHPMLRKEIERAIERDGKILDRASTGLSMVREGIRGVERRIREKLDGMLEKRELKPHIQDFYITERNGRCVIPVKSDSKGHIKGVIHNISNTGETVFTEPYEVQVLGNELEALRAEEKVEEFRVLKRLSGLLREELPFIEEDYRIVIRVDSLNAIASFSDMMAMSPPEINAKGYIKIVNGRHPLLWRTLRREGREKELVSLEFELGGDHRAIVITGSNTGGKTVVLKTVGILHLMALSGMHLPADSGTKIPFIRNLLADIGDEQSIEQSLSTFSGHITRISEIMRESSGETLALIDELGTGTDPDQGGALSCAVLRGLKKRGALTAVSTHLGSLKVFAHTEPGLVNGAMEMKAEITAGSRLYRPTYRLIIGEAGQSHAFEIAERFGLPPDVINEARGFSEGDGLQVEPLIAELKEKRGELSGKIRETAALKEELLELRNRAKEELSLARKKRRESLSDALREGEEIIRKTKREARKALKDIRRSEMDKASIAARGLDSRLAEISAERRSLIPDGSEELQSVSEGQAVFIKGLKTEGIVRSVNIKTGRCRVVVSGREIEVSLKELAGSSGEALQADGKRDNPGLPSGIELDSHAGRSVPAELSLVGQRVDPALSELERYLNDASISGLDSVKIIHGIGSGILSASVRDYLEDHPLVSRFRRGTEEEGGEAVTLLYF